MKNTINNIDMNRYEVEEETPKVLAPVKLPPSDSVTPILVKGKSPRQFIKNTTSPRKSITFSPNEQVYLSIDLLNNSFYFIILFNNNTTFTPLRIIHSECKINLILIQC